MRYFFYGTLLDPDVRSHILGSWIRRRELRPATLPGYRRVYIRYRHYPVAIPAPGDAVDGLLAEGLDRHAVRRLAEFESDEYVDAERTVLVDGGRAVRARVFVAGPLARPTDTPWTVEVWRRRHKREFARRFRAPFR